MHKSRFFGGIVLVASCLTGCGVATASPDEDALVPADPTKVSFVDPSTVPGLTARSLSEGENAGRHVHASFPAFDDAPELTGELRREAQHQLTAFEKATQGTNAPSKPELNMDWQLPAVTDQIIGVRLRTGVYSGADWGDSTKTLWFDRRSGRTRSLLQDRPAVRQAVLAQLTGRDIRPDLARDAFDSLTFNPDGDLVVEFDECEVSDCSQGRVAVAVPRDQARPLLTATGRLAQDAALQPVRRSPAAPTTPGSPPETTDCSVARCVALTFDDGPGPDTPRLLDMLDEAGAKATFFTVGLNAAASPGVVRRMARDGHAVANHSWSHRDLAKLSSSRITDSLIRTQDTLTAVTGRPPTMARPPYGQISKDVQAVSHRLGLALVNWSVDTQDGRDRNAATVARRAVEGARPGAIILMHDIHRTTVDAVPAVLKELRRKGFALVTVPELYGNARMQAGRLYTSGPLDGATR